MKQPVFRMPLKRKIILKAVSVRCLKKGAFLYVFSNIPFLLLTEHE